MRRLIIAGAFMAPVWVSAADAPSTLDAVVITATRLEEEIPQELAKTGVRVQTVSGEAIRNAGYDDVASALQKSVPGLYVKSKTGAFDYVDVALQGSRTNEVLWLVDGVRISNRLYNSTTPLDTLPAHMIDHIEVVEGGQGLFYGTSAVAGVINVVTRGFTEKARGQVELAGSNDAGRHVNANLSDAVGGHHFVLFGSSDEADGYRAYRAGDYQPSATDRERGYDVTSLGGKYGYNFSDRARLSASWQRTNATLDYAYAARSSASQPGGTAAAFNERVENIGSAKFDYRLSDALQFYAKGYYHRWDSHWTHVRNAITAPGTLRYESNHEFWGFKDYGANMLLKVAPGGALEYFAGYDYQNYGGRDDVLLIAQNAEMVHALFGQVRTTTQWLPNVVLAAGARYNAPSHGKKGTIWNVSGQWSASERLFVKGSIGTAFRLPDAYELFAIDPTCCRGNANLKPEQSRNLNLSVGGNVASVARALRWELVGFHREVRDLITDVDDGTGNTIAANVADRVRVNGYELVLGADLGMAWSANAGYTYTRSDGSTGLSGNYSQIPGIPRDQLQAGIDWHPNSAWGMSANVNHVGQVLNNVSGFGTQASGDYTVVDLAGRINFGEAGRHRLNLAVHNLFDTEFVTRYARGFRDVGATPYLTANIGEPRTVRLAYGYSW